MALPTVKKKAATPSKPVAKAATVKPASTPPPSTDLGNPSQKGKWMRPTSSREKEI